MYQSVMPTAVGVRLLLRHEAGVKRAGMCCSDPSAPPPWGLICSVGSGNRRNNDGEQIKD